AVLSNFVPQAAILDLPFLFPDRRTAYAVLGSEVRELLFNFFPKKGFVAIGFTENEFRDLTNSKRPIKSPADLQGLKIRTMESPIFIDTYKQLGANPVPMPFPEIYNALQQGVIDGQDNPLYTSILMKFTEVNKFASISGHLLTECIIIVNQDWWNKLKPEYQQILKEAAYNTEVVNRGYTLQDTLALKKLAKIDQSTCKETPGPSIYEVLKSQNVQVVELTAKDKEEFRKAVEPIYKKYREEIGGEFFDLFMAKIKEVTKNIK
ncbi:MAG: DctP family TRAP transporter solute-binding subunit, partial [Desulfatiglandales bacterium]